VLMESAREAFIIYRFFFFYRCVNKERISGSVALYCRRAQRGGNTGYSTIDFVMTTLLFELKLCAVNCGESSIQKE